MARQNERVFFNDGEYFVSDLRFVTRDGATYPMSTIQRVFRGQDMERPAWYDNCPLNLAILAMLVIMPLVGLASCSLGCGAILNLGEAGEPVGFGSIGEGVLSVVIGVILIILGIALSASPIIFIRRISRRNRPRPRYWVHFLFAGEGTFTTAIEQDARTQFLSIGNPASAPVQTTTRRNPDYSVWSYDQEWASRFYAAVNEARIAREAR